MNPLPSHAPSTLVLDVARDGDRLILAVYPPEAESPLRTYDTLAVDWATLDARCRDLAVILGQVSAGNRPTLEGTLTLRRVGHALFDQLLTPRAKETLHRAQPEILCLAIDERLTYIPWEMLHDGTLFWAERYALGRRVRTQHSVAQPPDRPRHIPRRVLIVADPQGNLVGAHNEGRRLRDRFTDRLRPPVSVQLITSRVTPAQVLDRLRECDLLHYAGHARYDRNHPGQSGWLLREGNLTPGAVLPMAGGGLLPSLVFANACGSGQGVGASDAAAVLLGPMPLANAFLLAGVRHYLGTSWEIPDAASATFAAAFYESLLTGAPIGVAVRSARLACLAEYGEGSVIWASYLLYGDPAVPYFPAEADGQPMAAPSDERHAVPRLDPPSPVAVRSTGRVRANPRPWIAGVGVTLLACLAMVGVAGHWWDDGRFPVTRPSHERSPQAALLRGIVAESDGAGGIAARAYADGLRQAPDDPYLLAFARQGEPRLAEANRSRRVADLIDRIAAYQAAQPAAAPQGKTGWTSRPLTLAVVAIDPRPAPGLPAATAIQVERRLQQLWEAEGRLHLVDRQHLEPILEELHLAAARLASPDGALPIGTLASAQLLAVGELIELGEALQLNVRLIETASSAVVAATVQPLPTLSDLDNTVARTAADLMASLRHRYPLRAEVIGRERDQLTLNIGADLGVAPGALFRTVPTGDDAPIVVRVESVDAHGAHARPLAGGAAPMLAPGSRLEQVWDEAG